MMARKRSHIELNASNEEESIADDVVLLESRRKQAKTNGLRRSYMEEEIGCEKQSFLIQYQNDGYTIRTKF